MPRGIPQPAIDQIQEGEIKPAFFAEFEFDTEPVYTWNGTQRIEFDGREYIGTGQLLKASPVQETQELKASDLKFSLSAIPNEAVSDAKNKNYQDRPCRLKMAFASQEGKIFDYPFLLFEGFMDIFRITMGSDTATIEVTAESRMKLLKEKNEKRYTHEDQQYRFPNDMFFEFVNELQEKQISFGP